MKTPVAAPKAEAVPEPEAPKGPSVEDLLTALALFRAHERRLYGRPREITDNVIDEWLRVRRLL